MTETERQADELQASAQAPSFSSADARDQGALAGVPVELIDLDVPNHRLVEDPKALDELAASIREHGLQQPVRVYPKDGGCRYVLGFGFRRLAAVKRLGWVTIPAFVMHEAGESEIRVAQAIENLERANLSPLEEATALDAIVQARTEQIPLDHRIADAANAIGRPGQWVRNRLALLRLSPRVRTLLMNGRLTLGHAQLIARVSDEDRQEEIAGRVARDEKGEGGEPVSHCKYRVEGETATLGDAKWPLNVAFAGKPACNECPHNSVNAPGLFDGDVPAKARCLSLSCFRVKREAAGVQVRKVAEKLAALRVEATPTAIASAVGVKGTKGENGNGEGESAQSAKSAVPLVIVRPAAVKAHMAKIAARNKPSKSEKLGRAVQEQKRAEDSAEREAQQRWANACAEALNAAVSKLAPPRLFKLAWALDCHGPDRGWWLVASVNGTLEDALIVEYFEKQPAFDGWSLSRHAAGQGKLEKWVPELAAALKVTLPAKEGEKGVKGENESAESAESAVGPKRRAKSKKGVKGNKGGKRRTVAGGRR